MQNKLIIAHRGASREAPENTLQAFQKAIELGADVIELDVRRAKNGCLAVIHDADVKGQAVKELTYEQSLNLNDQIPTLEQALNLIAGKAQVHIEMKAMGYEIETAEQARKILQPSQFYIISFYADSLGKIKKYFPEIRTGLILGSSLYRLRQTLRFALQRRRILEFTDLLAINWKLWKWGLAKIIPKQHPITVWIVDDPRLMRKLFQDRRIQGIASNDPRLAVQLRSELL